MKERPILFSAPMVRAVLTGTKTQTRRVFHPRGWDLLKLQAWRFLHVLSNAALSALTCKQPGDTAYAGFMTSPDSGSATYFKCPYGQPGDRLWVRETARCDYRGEHTPPDRPATCAIGVTYAAGGGKMQPYAQAERDNFPWFPSRSTNVDMTPRWAPAIHMPRWASRILLEIVSVRVEKLQTISEADALAEGIAQLHDGGFGLPAGEHYHFSDPRQSYFSLWEAINGPGSVEANSWVWVVEFKRVEATHA